MKSKISGILLILLGLALLGGAGWLAAENLREEQTAAEAGTAIVEQIRQEIQLQKPTEAPTAPDVPEDSLPEETLPEIHIPDHIRDPHIPMPTVEVDGKAFIGIVDIPALELSLPVCSDWSYPQLKKTPCRYQGSAYLDDFIIMAHNYQTHFGTLVNLRIGDAVYFTDAAGNVFGYTVVELETLAGTEVEEMKAGQWDLTLFTCTLGGQKRVTVRCERQ